MNVIKYATDCPQCGVDLTCTQMVRIHLPLKEQLALGIEGHVLSCLTEDGRLRDSQGVISKGFQAYPDKGFGVYCEGCDKQLPKLDSSGEPVSLRWYVRTECGDVRGPMSQEDAESESGRLDGAVMFNERIFEPEFVTTEEVEEVLAALGTLDSWVREDYRNLGGHTEEIGIICKRARNALILLSKKQTLRFIMSEEIASLIVDLGDMKVDCNSDVDLLQRAIDGLVSLSREKVVSSVEVQELLRTAKNMRGQVAECPTCENEWLERVMLALTSLSREKVVTGHIEGGVLNLEKVPEGVTVDIRDYDTDGVAEVLKTDENGDQYFEAV